MLKKEFLQEWGVDYGAEILLYLNYIDVLTLLPFFYDKRIQARKIDNATNGNVFLYSGAM